MTTPETYAKILSVIPKDEWISAGEIAKRLGGHWRGEHIGHRMIRLREQGYVEYDDRKKNHHGKYRLIKPMVVETPQEKHQKRGCTLPQPPWEAA